MYSDDLQEFFDRVTPLDVSSVDLCTHQIAPSPNCDFSVKEGVKEGVCILCGVNFSDSDNVNSIIQNCNHKDQGCCIIENAYGEAQCSRCKVVLSILDHSQEWRAQICGDKDQSRCKSSFTYNPKKKMKVDSNKILPAIMEKALEKYEFIIETKGEIPRGSKKRGVYGACLFFSYKEIGEAQSSVYIQEVLQINQKAMTQGFNIYYSVFDADKTQEVSVESLIPATLNKIGLKGDVHIQTVTNIYKYFADASKPLKRSKAPSKVNACVYYYISTNNIDVNKTIMNKVLAGVTIKKITDDMLRITVENANL